MKVVVQKAYVRVGALADLEIERSDGGDDELLVRILSARSTAAPWR